MTECIGQCGRMADTEKQWLCWSCYVSRHLKQLDSFKPFPSNHAVCQNCGEPAHFHRFAMDEVK